MNLVVTKSSGKIEFKTYSELIAKPGIYDVYYKDSQSLWDGGKVLVAGGRAIWIYSSGDPYISNPEACSRYVFVFSKDTITLSN